MRETPLLPGTQHSYRTKPGRVQSKFNGLGENSSLSESLPLSLQSLAGAQPSHGDTLTVGDKGFFSRRLLTPRNTSRPDPGWFYIIHDRGALLGVFSSV